jgi:hypothetical protein
VDLNPGRLLQDDNGYFKVFLGNRRTVYMITIIEDTPSAVREKPEGGILIPLHPFLD